jgi:putative transposase
MSRDTTVIAFRQPEAIDNPLSELAREGARRMLVLIAEADCFVAMWKDLKWPDGRDRVVRHGYGPHRAIQTGVRPVEVRRAKVRDRGEVGAEEKIRFTSSILPKWARRTKSLDACCRFSTCVGCRPATSRRCSPLSWARTRQTSRRP